MTREFGDAQQAEQSLQQHDTLEALKMLGKVQLRELADATGQDRGNLFRRLQSLVQKKLVERTKEYGRVFYHVE